MIHSGYGARHAGGAAEPANRSLVAGWAWDGSRRWLPAWPAYWPPVGIDRGACRLCSSSFQFIKQLADPVMPLGSRGKTRLRGGLPCDPPDHHHPRRLSWSLQTQRPLRHQGTSFLLHTMRLWLQIILQLRRCQQAHRPLHRPAMQPQPRSQPQPQPPPKPNPRHQRRSKRHPDLVPRTYLAIIQRNQRSVPALVRLRLTPLQKARAPPLRRPSAPATANALFRAGGSASSTRAAVCTSTLTNVPATVLVAARGCTPTLTLSTWPRSTPTRGVSSSGTTHCSGCAVRVSIPTWLRFRLMSVRRRKPCAQAQALASRKSVIGTASRAARRARLSNVGAKAQFKLRPA